MLCVVLLALGFHVSRAHMSMAYPVPRKTARVQQTVCNSAPRQQSYLTWEWNEPMVPMRPCTCHGTLPDTTIRPENVFRAGDTISVTLAGTAFHNGGQCSFWWSVDGRNFKKFVDFNHCTTAAVQGRPINIVIPAGVDTACGTRCILGWTWTPVSSGACEIYMTCADVRIIGATGGGIPIQQFDFDTQINSASCARPNPATGWSALFTPFNTNGMSGGGGGGPPPTTTTAQPPPPGQTTTTTTTKKPTNVVITARPTTTTTRRIGTYAPDGSLCNPPGLPNWGPINTNNGGKCGPGVGACDWGLCCSSGGFCGPELKGYDAQGNAQYTDYSTNPPGVYPNPAEAFGAYCASAQADYRLVPCCAIQNGIYYPALASCYTNYSPGSTSPKPPPPQGTTNAACSSSTVPCQIKIMSTSNKWWMAVWIENQAGSSLLNVRSTQAKGGGGAWVAGHLQTWNTRPWVFQPGGSGFQFPITIKITMEDSSIFYACNTITALAGGNADAVLTNGMISENVGCQLVAGYNSNPSSQQGGGSATPRNGGKENVGLIVTLCVGGVVLLILVVVGCVFLNRRSKEKGPEEYALMSDQQ